MDCPDTACADAPSVLRLRLPSALVGALLAGLFLSTCLVGCGADNGIALPNEQPTESLEQEGYDALARFVFFTDVHVTDEESPARLPTFTTGSPSAWRPQEPYSTQILDGTIRAVNAMHAAGRNIDFVISAGDAIDNRQTNELNWFCDVFDGKQIDPLSGVDDRPVDNRPPADLDPHVPFQAEGLYHQGVHGELPAIPWYAAIGNHDSFALGIFPVLRNLSGRLVAPLPGPLRVGLLLPTVLYPAGSIAYNPITPDNPGPFYGVGLPTRIMPVPERRYLTVAEMLERFRDTDTTPVGHGFPDGNTTWYSVSPLDGLRLIVLNTSDVPLPLIGGIYDAGAVSAAQVDFLKRELERADARGELVIVVSHHPSYYLLRWLGSALTGSELVDLLNEYPNVIAHLAGHSHRHRVWDRGGYVEFETAAIIDYPQEARLIEIWRRGDEVALRYEVFSHVYEGAAFAELSPPPDDPYLAMRRTALDLARVHSESFELLPVLRSSPEWETAIDAPDERLPLPTDRNGMWQKRLHESRMAPSAGE